MKKQLGMLLFFVLVIAIYGLVNLYIYKQSGPIFAIGNPVGKFLKIIFIVLVISYPAGRLFERLIPSEITNYIIKAGSIWLGAMVYLCLFLLFIHLIRLTIPLLGQINICIHADKSLVHKKIVIATYIVTAIMLLGGYINARHPKVNRIPLITHKNIEGYPTLRVGAASDIHLGVLMSNGRLKQFVNMMNSLNPDIILLAGDIFDEDIGFVVKNDMGKLLSELKAPLGVYAVTGNHEYIGGVEPAVEYLEKHGVKVLRDSAIVVKGIFNLVGREDRQAKMIGGIDRKPLSDLTRDLDTNKLTILLDHQPFRLSESVENAIDLQISGHTHHGQLFPFNLITGAIFEVSKGLKRIDGTTIYVSNGYGTWGPPIRVGNKPEIILFEIVEGK
ncbi:MAG: metallophosphoesterase [Tenuifilaceae bacterium]